MYITMLLFRCRVRHLACENQW